jgi:hypothetical protein
MDLLENKGVPLERQTFTWKDMVGKPISKLDDEAFTRVRVILMNGLERDALRLAHMGARFHADLRRSLADIRRVEQHQATTVNWLISADHSPLEMTIAYEQCRDRLQRAPLARHRARRVRPHHQRRATSVAPERLRKRP